MMSLRDSPHVVDIRTVGLLCGIDLEPIADRPGCAAMRPWSAAITSSTSTSA